MQSIDDRPWQRMPIPSEVAAVPAMLDDEERRYFMWVTSAAYEGFGAVVDLGPWLGGSSVALAEGLRRRGRPVKVHSFDIFLWDANYMRENFACDLPEGADFQPLFRRHTAAYADWIDDRKMDLMHGAWDGGPIEILFVDAAKSWGLLREILRVFGPHLVPGRSRVIHQDFRHPPCPWLPLACDSRPDVWRQVESVEVGTTVTFVPQRKLAAAEADDLVRENLDYETKKRVFTRRIETDGPAHAWRYRLALCVEALRAGDIPLAQSLRRDLDRVQAADPQAGKMVPLLFEQHRLETGWRLLNEGRVTEALALAEQIEPDSHCRYFGLVLVASAARQCNQLARAEAALAEARSLDPLRFEAHLETAWLRLAQARFPEGEAEVVKAMCRDPGPSASLLPSFHRVHSLLVGHQSRPADALAANDRFLALMPGNRDGLVDRARLFQTTGRLAEARAALQLALAQDPGYLEAAKLMAQVESALGR